MSIYTYIHTCIPLPERVILYSGIILYSRRAGGLKYTNHPITIPVAVSATNQYNVIILNN